MKTLFWFLAATTLFGFFTVTFGYLDPDLANDRRWLGCASIVVGMAVVWLALMRLAEDWPRAKPQHDADLAFAQIGLGVVVLVIACLMGGRIGQAFSPLIEPIPKFMVSLGFGEDPKEPAGPPSTNRQPRR